MIKTYVSRVSAKVATISRLVVRPDEEELDLPILLNATSSLWLEGVDSVAFVASQRAHLRRIRSLDLYRCRNPADIPWQIWSKVLPNLLEFSICSDRQDECPHVMDLSGFSRLVKVTIECDGEDGRVRLRLPKTVTTLKHNRTVKVTGDEILPRLNTLSIHTSEVSKDPRATAIQIDWTRFPALRALVLHDHVAVSDADGNFHVPLGLKDLEFGSFAAASDKTLCEFTRRLSLQTLSVSGLVIEDKLKFLEELDGEFSSANDLTMVLPLRASLQRLSCRGLAWGGVLDTKSLAQLERLSQLRVSGSGKPIIVDLGALAECRALTRIDLHHCVEIKRTVGLTLPHIRSLGLHHVKDWACLDAFPNLRDLSISAFFENLEQGETLLECKRQLSSLRLLEWAKFRYMSSALSKREWRPSEIARQLPSNCVISLRWF